MKTENFNKDLILLNSQGLSQTDAIPLITNGADEISLRYTSNRADHPSYAWFTVNGPAGHNLRMANKAQLDRILSKSYALSDLNQVLVNELPTAADLGKIIQANSNSRNKPAELDKSEMDSLQTQAEAMMTTDPQLITAMDKFFSNPEMDASQLAPKPNFYEFEIDGVKQARMLNMAVFSYIGGELYLTESIKRVYKSLTAKEEHGVERHTHYEHNIKSDKSFTIKKSVKMSKLGLSFGFNFSAMLPASNVPDLGSKKSVLDGANVVKQGDPAYKDGKKQDFTFGVEHLSIHAKLMVKAIDKLEASYTPVKDMTYEFEF